ncbi:MAG: hypothetical protein WBD40_02325 [Tepidisphaeraceae bacterium]
MLPFEPLEARRLLAFDDLGDELAAQLSDLQSDLHAALDTASRVPLLNQHLDEAAALDLFPQAVLDQLKSGLNGQTDQSAIAVALFDVLGPSGANVLGAKIGDGAATTVGDVGATVAGTSVQLSFELYRELNNQAFPFAFGLGLPGIPFNVTSTGGIGLNVELTNTGVGFSYTEGGTSGLTPGDFGVAADAFLTPGTALTGTFGFFQVSAEDLTGNTRFDGTFNITGLGGATPTTSLSGEGVVGLHLTLGAGPQFPSLQADFDVAWSFDNGTPQGSEPFVSFSNVGIGLGTFFTSVMKPMLENIQVFTKPHQPVIDILKARIPGLSDGTNAIGLGDVSLLSLVRTLNDNAPLSPDIQGYVNLATVLIETTDIINKTDLTGTDAFINFGGFNLTGDHNPDLRGGIDGIAPVNFANIGNHGVALTTLSPGLGTGFDLQDVIQQVRDKVTAGDLPASIQQGMEDAFDRMSNRAGYKFPILDDPVGGVFKLLLGQDVDLAEFEVRFNQKAGFKDDTPYSLYGYGIDLKGTIDIDAYFKTAYDTLGLRRFLASLGGTPQPGRLLDGLYIDDTTHLIVGGEIKAELDIPGGIVGVTVEGGVRTPPGDPLSLTIHDPDTDGLGDDGKLRLFTGEIDDGCVLHADGELTASFKMTVRVGVTVPDPLDPFGDPIFVGVKKDLLGGSHTMIKLGELAGGPECLGAGTAAVPPPPILAGITGDHNLLLFIGPNATQRQNVPNTPNSDIAEAYQLTHLGGTTGDETILVSAFGVSQTFEHVKTITGFAGEFDDTVSIEQGVLAPATLTGGNGNDKLAYLGAAAADLSGNDGNDVVTGGNGNDLLFGGLGDDLISTGAGNNLAVGGANNDQLFGGTGKDTLRGEGGDDTASGGGGDDTIEGGAGNDDLEGGADDDLILADAGADTANGGAGNDTVKGEDDNDFLIGDADDDLILGGSGADFIAADVVTFVGGAMIGSLEPGGGDDTVLGESGNDIIFGQGGDDSIEGNAGGDAINGGAGNDKLIGGSASVVGADGSDLISGEAGNDTILGDDGIIGSVTLLGGSGNDTLGGGDGNDSIWGQGGNDSILGNADDDDLIGNDGNDSIDGGNGVDVVLGDNGAIVVTLSLVPETTSFLRTITLNTSPATDGNDSVAGGDNADSVFGQGGNDTVSGDGGMDYLEGNQGADSMSGGAGDDDMIGGSPVAGSADGDDTMSGGSGNDVIAGDNALLARVIEAGNVFARYTTTGLQNGAVIRNVTLLDLDTLGGNDSISGGDHDDTVFGQFGNDSIFGDAGHDDLIGHLGADLIDGGAGDDGILGDKGTILGSIVAGPARTIAGHDTKLTALIDVPGTRRRSVTLIDFALGSGDSLVGGADNDSIHGGAGADSIEGDDPALPAAGGADALFGDSENDSINGGAGGDHLYGGAGNNSLNGQLGADTIHGGDGDDDMYADVPEDRLVDFLGNFNNFHVPNSSYGSPTILRSGNDKMQQFLADLAAADGSTDPQLELVIVGPSSPPNSGNGGRTK